MPEKVPRSFSPEEMESYRAELRQTYLYADPQQTAKDEVRAFLALAVKAAVQAGALPGAACPAYVVEVPADAKNGDLAANLALVSAKAFGMPPRKIADAILAHAPATAHSAVEKVEVAGPGFINITLRHGFFAGVMAACVCQDDYGRTRAGRGQKVNVEFVSANPTGPMHLGNARGGALGDCLAAALEWTGCEVTREFYVNDAGNQIAKFGRSLAARYLELVQGGDAPPFPEDGYQGEDIRAHARAFLELHGEGPASEPEEALQAALVAYALPRNIEGLKQDLAAYRVGYDVWFRESALHQSGAVEKAVRRLAQRGYTYEKDGAVWYKTPGEDEKDEVLVRANGVPTYFAADIAYHANKFERGFTQLIDAWGADHHGHVARMKQALNAVGEDGGKLDVVLFQMVNLVRGGQPVRMSKRTGKAITLSSLTEEVPIDSARFFFNMREPGSTIEFDLDLAAAKDSDNPVYYVQYAHARVASILRNLAAEGVRFCEATAFGHARLLAGEAERGLIRAVAAFPGEIASAAESRNPSRITRYLVELATAFHKFYSTCRIKGEEEGLLQARLALAVAAKTVLKNGLTLLKITAPEQM